jgi:hypothetical protein
VTSPVEFRFGDDRREAEFYTLTSAETAGADPSSWTVYGSNDGRRWKELDEREDEKFDWRLQTRPFKLERDDDYSYYRIRFSDPAAVRLAEVELLTNDRRVATPLEVEAVGGVVRPGQPTTTVKATVFNWGDASLSGQVTASVPEGWTVTPASAAFGPIARGQSQEATFEVRPPAGTKPGSYPIEVRATSAGVPVARASANVSVVGDVIEFTPDTAAEAPWLHDADGSQFDGRGRFADNERYFVYRFEIGDDVTAGTLSLLLRAEFLVQVSNDGATWRTVLEETRRITDGTNEGTRDLDLMDLVEPGETLYLRIADSFPDDGWGGWLARLRLEQVRG